MSTFICNNCGCIDNSAKGGNYWTRFRGNENQDPEPVICCECNGKQWHNSFPKEHWSKHGTKEELIAESKKRKGNYDNAVEYFNKNES
jgi:hypothetical protein